MISCYKQLTFILPTKCIFIPHLCNFRELPVQCSITSRVVPDSSHLYFNGRDDLCKL